MAEKSFYRRVISEPEPTSNRSKVFLALIGLKKDMKGEATPQVKPDKEKEKAEHDNNLELVKRDVERYRSLMKNEKYLDAAYLALANGLGNGRVKRAANHAYNQFMISEKFFDAFMISKELSLHPAKIEEAKFKTFVKHLKSGEYCAASVFAGTSQLSKKRIFEGIIPILLEHKQKANPEAILELALPFNVLDDTLLPLFESKRE